MAQLMVGQLEYWKVASLVELLAGELGILKVVWKDILLVQMSVEWLDVHLAAM